MKTSIFLFAAALCASTAAFGQSELQLRVRRQPGWDARTREGRCDIRLWVDNRAEIRLRGDAVFVRTVEGARGRDEGSECSQPLPFNSVRGFQIRQTAGRNRVELAQEPSRMNNFTAMFAIDDRQGGGDNYAFEVTWLAETDLAAAPAPFFDDVRACQDAVRQRFLSQNGRGSYIDFDTFADRRSTDQGRGQEQRDGRNLRNSGGRNTGRESIAGRGNARSPGEARDLTYSCDVDMRQNQVLSGSYNYTGESQRGNGTFYNRRPLR
jgi:hypothetical protein